MAELHSELIVRFRKQLIAKGFREAKSPMPDFRPDIFAQKFTVSNKVTEEVVVEAEIESTLYSEHTTTQLVKMIEYMEFKKRLKVSGYLLVPKGARILSLANSLLDTLDSKTIKVIQY